jgi:hypothetical protein
VLNARRFCSQLILTRALVHVAGAGGRGAGGRRQPRLRGLARTHVARLREAQGRGGHQQRPEKGKTLFGLGFGAAISNHGDRMRAVSGSAGLLCGIWANPGRKLDSTALIRSSGYKERM